MQDKLFPEQDDLAQAETVRNEWFDDKQGGSRCAKEK
jgi:hypothetical protein